MPPPIRPAPNRPTIPTVPTSPVGPTPGPITTPVAPARFPVNLDTFDTSGTTTPRLAQPLPLGDFDGVAVTINSQGRLTLANDDGRLEDTLAAHRVVLKGSEGKNPFAGVTDKVALRAVVDQLAALHKAGTAEAVDDKHMLDQRQLRATSLGLMELAAIRAGELGDRSLQGAMVKQLTSAIKKEPFRPLKDFAWESLVGRAADKTLPSAAAAKEAVYPSKPPVDKMLADGVLRVAYNIDNEGSELDYQLSFLRSMGFKEKKVDEQNYVFTKEARGNRPKTEILLRSPKDHQDKPRLFEKMDDPSIDIIAYTGHAGYGHRVDSAINDGVKGSGEGKVVVLMQCWGVGNVESLERAFPDAQVISTTEPSTDNHDQFMFEKLLDGIVARKSYAAMAKEVSDGMRDAWWKDDADPDKHFFFPNNREILGAKMDRDVDGVRDLTDHIFNVVYPKRLDAAGGYDPVAQAIADDALDGSASSKAVNTLSLVMRYNELLPQAAATTVKWGPDNIQPAGFFTPADGDLHAFKFARDAATGKLNIKTSTRFAHTAAGDLSKMLAYEAGQFLGKEAALDDAGTMALSLTMLERAAHQESAWKWARSLLDEPWAEETLLAQRYGLGELRIGDINEALEDADHLTADHVNKVKALVDGRLVAAVGKSPVRVGEPLAVPADLRLAANGLDKTVLQRVVDKLGIAGTVESFGPAWMNGGEPNNLAVVVRNAADQTSQIGLSLDADGIIRTASRVDLQVDAAKVRAGKAYLDQVAKALNRDRGPLQAAYDAQVRTSGKAPIEAVAAVLAAERKGIPMGTELPALGPIDQLRTYGLTTMGESTAILETMARMYPRGHALKAEQAVAEWIGSLPQVNQEELRQAYVQALADSGSRDGAGAALEAVLAKVPQPVAGFPLRQIVSSKLVSPAALPSMLRAWKEKAGATHGALARELVIAWYDYGVPAPTVAALDELVARNASGKEVLDKMLELHSPPSWPVPRIDMPLLEELGVLSSPEAIALAQTLERLSRVTA